MNKTVPRIGAMIGTVLVLLVYFAPIGVLSIFHFGKKENK